MSDEATEPKSTSRLASTRDDLEEIKTYVKQLAQELRSLAPKHEVEEPQRQFRCDPKKWLQCVRPTPQRLKLIDRMLCQMFFGDPKNSSWFREARLFEHFPSFARNLTLHFVTNSGPKEISLRDRDNDVSADQVQEYIMKLKFEPSYDDGPVNDFSNQWSWPSASFADIYHVSGNIDKGSDQYEVSHTLHTTYGKQRNLFNLEFSVTT
ncbi:hypothetical protein F4679DRAFT_462545 [Xylaria curta]|nr:hypothetical protein F4679DRAFT_462545 [Xylaria curta]